MTIYLIRHSETDWNQSSRIQGTTDIPLNAAGREHSSRLALTFAQEHPDVAAVYASRLIRARETADAIAKALRLPVIEKSGLEELCFGSFEGKTFAEAEGLYPAAAAAIRNGDLDARAPGGESTRELLLRAAKALAEIAAACPGDAVAVTHGALIGRLFGYLSGRMPTGKRYTQVDNGSVRALDSSVLPGLIQSLQRSAPME